MNSNMNNQPVAAPYYQPAPGYYYQTPPAPAGEKKESAFLSVVKGLLYILLYMGVQVILSIGLIFYQIFSDAEFAAKYLADPFGMQNELIKKVVGDMQAQYVMMIIAAALTLAILLIVQLARKKKLKEEFHIKKISPLVGLVAFGCGFLLNFAVTFIMNHLPSEVIDEYSEKMGYGGSIAVYIIAAVICAPIIEEILFRNFTLTRFNRAMPEVAAVLVSAFCFGLAHLDRVQSVYAAALGVLLGYAFVRTGSIFTSMLIHFGFNMVSIIGLMIEKMNLSGDALMTIDKWFYYFSGAALFASVPLVILFFRLTAKKKDPSSASFAAPPAEVPGTPYFTIPMAPASVVFGCPPDPRAPQDPGAPRNAQPQYGYPPAGQYPPQYPPRNPPQYPPQFVQYPPQYGYPPFGQYPPQYPVYFVPYQQPAAPAGENTTAAPADNISGTALETASEITTGTTTDTTAETAVETTAGTAVETTSETAVENASEPASETPEETDPGEKTEN